ncbi:MAG: PAS domain-containing sensor histidine kinase [Candidatus Zixiibacteriota bacterium]|nr:MAG: PAS domain-containing sensor histidine kinase [candidate division Zixibacteria bacterium]
MVTKQARPSTGFTRCAVCKIDLKGRFVYLDEKVENLLGFSKEELFGKPLQEFVDGSSQQLIEDLLAQRNHYETFYDTTSVALVHRDGSTVNARAIVSLNFIAGNPVNFQLILDCPDAAGIVRPGSAADTDFRSLVANLLERGQDPDLKLFLEMLCPLVRAEKGCLYLISESGLDPVWSVSGEGGDALALGSIPDTGRLHQRVAGGEEEYSFVNQKNVQKVIEEDGTAPSEYVARIQLQTGESYLLRLFFSDDFDHQAAAVSVADARMALNLACRVWGGSGGEEAEGVFDIKFTVGFLDSLGIAAFLIDSEGDVVGYNPSMLKVLPQPNLEGSYLRPLDNLLRQSRSGTKERIVEYITGTQQGVAATEDLSLIIKTPAGEIARLVVMRLGDSAKDLSSCFVLVPERSADIRPARDSDADDSVAILPVLEGAARWLKTQIAQTDTLAHRFYNGLGDEGNDLLGKLSADTKRAMQCVKALRRFTRIMKKSGQPRLVDLNLLVRQRLDDLLSTHHGAEVVCRYDDLPKVKANQRLLSEVLYNLLSNCLKYNDKGKIEISVSAEVSDGTCRLTVSDNGFGIDARHLPRVFDLFYRAPDKRVEKTPGSGLGLVFAKKIAESMGGDITVTATDGEGTSVRLSFPTG